MNQTNKSYDNAVIKKLEESRVEISASVPVEIWEKFRTKALKNLNETVTIDGFRKGNIPENVLTAKVGEMVVLEEMAELALPKAYMDILIDNKIDAIGRPEISVTKLAKNNPLEFKAVTAVVPEIKLPDYKKLAAEQVRKTDKPVEKISDKELDEAILRVRKMHASHEGHDHEKMTPEEHEKAIMDNLPELTDDFVKKIGNFNDIPDFKNKLSEMLAEDKKVAAREKTRISIADAIAAQTVTELPEIMIQSELDRTQSQFEADIERMGVKIDDYLKHAKKSIEDVRKEWAPHAEKKAKLQLILNEIAKLENIKPSPTEVETEVNHIVEHYKDADRERASIYAETVLTNEKVFEFLETPVKLSSK
ncbi:MAG: trigger factor [Candidatus Taylorbacteria bacterium]|nr:trigger factor [Candidatus Taylorbacteria bacterium]